MSLIYKIDDYEIPASLIISNPLAKEQITFDSNKLITSSLDFELSNADRTQFDDRYAGSLFYGSDFYRKPVEAYDTELGLYVWKGVITNIIIDDSEGKIVVETKNYIDLLKTVCIYSNFTDKTPAQCIYEIITECALIPEDAVVYRGFQKAINIQADNSVYTNVNYTEEDNRTCLDVITELARISLCELFTQENMINFYQWQPWAGEIGTRVTRKSMLPQTYKHYYEPDEIMNSYSIAYMSGSSVLYASDADSVSVNRNGESLFSVPEDSMDSSTASEFKILIRNLTGATYIGNLALQRYADLCRYGEFSVKDYLSYVQISEQFDLDVSPYNREPVRILEREHNRREKVLTVKCKFLNIPEYYSRDVVAPDPVVLYTVMPLGGGAAMLKWSKNYASDFLGYKVYFTSTPGEWESEISMQGISPLDVKTNNMTPDGYVYSIIRGLNPGTEYLFKISVYDTSYNESDYSNMLKCRIGSFGTENLYNLTGDLYVSGLTLDMTNPGGGQGLDAWAEYDTAEYDSAEYSPTAMYESPLLRKSSGFTSMRFQGTGDSGDIKIQYRFRVNGEYQAWSELSDAVGLNAIDLQSQEYFQYRVIFYSPHWTDSDKFIIKEII